MADEEIKTEMDRAIQWMKLQVASGGSRTHKPAKKTTTKKKSKGKKKKSK